VSYLHGLAHLGSLAISDSDLKRIEKLKATAVDDANKLMTRADETARKLRGAVVANAVITGLSTIVLVGMALKTRGARAWQRT
jgi:hypothetical protein